MFYTCTTTDLSAIVIEPASSLPILGRAISKGREERKPTEEISTILETAYTVSRQPNHSGNGQETDIPCGGAGVLWGR